MNLKLLLFFLFLPILSVFTHAQSKSFVQLENDSLKIQWIRAEGGWKIHQVALSSAGKWMDIPNPSGEYTLIRSEELPPKKSEFQFQNRVGNDFPEYQYIYQQNLWKEQVSPVNLNTAGEAQFFFPDQAVQVDKYKVRFEEMTTWGKVSITWSLDPNHPQDLLIRQEFEVAQDGFYSLSSPSLITIPDSELEWATVPGYFHGNRLEENLPLGYGYGNGVPTAPIVFREQTMSTLSPILSSKIGFTVAVVSNPELGRDPWEKDKMTHNEWKVGLSHKNRRASLSPSLYFPVLGEIGSEKKRGDSLDFSFRFSLSGMGWFETLNHVVYDVFRFREGLDLRKNQQSLSDRVNRMFGYLTDSVTSLWRVETFDGRRIGAQAYLGGVVGSDKDAMKNSDYGAMWMLAEATRSHYLKEEVLPYALDFKLAQQQVDPGFFQGAAIGQYYLSKSRQFVEEWGKMVEPIALTYYMMLDIGNILLFEPENEELKGRLRLGAELLLDWQKEDGSWAVAYSREQEEIFRDLKDFRPTFYGLLVGYRILKDKDYLEAAVKGADWFLENGVKNGSFLGVCGDMRYAPDFATGQTAQAYLDLFDLTGYAKYRDAAIQAAKIYTTYIYTHPIPNREFKMVNGNQVQDWEIAQAGLSFEHGGTLGSANLHGPILLASHAGMFIRMHQLTREPIFVDMARAATIGRHVFVDEKTSVASYYWKAMNAGAGPFPHHAWWQVGWITDYLLAEVEFRTNGNIRFPRGFITPKVGPHQSYGFEAGEIFGQKGSLKIVPEMVEVSNPSVEYVLASNESEEKVWVILLNQQNLTQSTDLKVNLSSFNTGKVFKISVLDSDGSQIEGVSEDSYRLNLLLPALGIRILEFSGISD